MSKLTFEISGKEYSLPDFLSIGDYQKIFKFKDLFDDEYFGVKIINKLTGAPLEDLMNTNYTAIEYLVKYILLMFPQKNNQFIDRFEIDDIKYGFIDSWRNMSYGEYVDLDTLFSRKDSQDYLHIIMAILYRPIITEKDKKYTIEKYNSDNMLLRADIFQKKLDIKYYFGAQFFFTLFATKFQLRTLASSMNLNPSLVQKIKFVWKNRKIINKTLLSETSDGQLLQTEFAKMILQNTIQSTKNHWWKFSIKLPFSKKEKTTLKEIPN